MNRRHNRKPMVKERTHKLTSVKLYQIECGDCILTALNHVKPVFG